ncbi:MAG: hypothetical protein AMJ60_04730 [Desulfobacterales bacterium SG8_35]|nr:MAG: hypothetical protein AMJ60_04730 [Desulfobacterales bacterium SG8_35]
MTPRSKERLRELQLAFVGKLMASLSHEFKNHLAIIRESSGLIEDLLLLEEQGQTSDRERYKKIISVIGERVAQAAEMCRFLSGFAHRMDQPLSSLSVTDVLQEEIYLLHRFARQKQVDLVSSFAENVPAIFNDPALLQFAVFCIVWPALQGLEKDSRIEIAVGRQNGAVEIVVNLEGTRKEPEGTSPWEELLPEVLHMLGAAFSRRIGADGNEVMAVTISSIKPSDRSDT